jgi:transposase
MTHKEIFATALGIQAPWFVDSIDLDPVKEELNIRVDFRRGSLFEYTDEDSGEISEYKAYDTTEKTWRHMNFFQFRCYIKARIPRVKLGNGKVKQVKAPWEGISHGFTLLFEAFVMQLVEVMTVHQVCETIGTYDNKVWDIAKSYTEACRGFSDYSNVRKIGIDETSARRGHDYVTLFVDMDEKKTLFVTEGKSSETIKEFVEDFHDHCGNIENIEQVSCDMSPAFIKGIEENLPNADITFDKFHVINVINKAIDEVRKEEVKLNPLLKGSKYVFLKNRVNHTAKQKALLRDIAMSKLNIQTFKALQIRESFQQIYLCENKYDFETLLKKWYFWATHSRIPKIIKAAKTIKMHWDGIVNWAESRITNGILEGFNSIFQAAKAKARGYKRTETIKTIFYILTGKLDFSLVNPYCATHTLL